MGFIGIYFEWGLFILMVASGIIYLIDQRFFYKKRKALAESAPDYAGLSRKQKLLRLKGPVVTDYARSLFWVFFVVLLIRSFLYEPYIVPSGSMLPTIQLGDFVLVDKYAYGLRLPLVGTKIIPVSEPERGDVVVFKSPVNPQTDFIKTVIGLPGDKISYVDKQLTINGEAVPQVFVKNTLESDNATDVGSPLVVEDTIQLGKHVHTIYNSPSVPAVDFQNLVVPAGHYFVMGDNRDASDDSRYWGFVSEAQLVGRANVIFFSYDSTTHSVRWNRIGMKLP